MDPIYLDHNATTPLLPAVEEAMRPFYRSNFGNPGSAHWAGRRARQALEDARERVASLLGAWPDEVIFTSGATEANNLAIFGLAGAEPGHVVTSPVEHPSVGEPLAALRRRGFVIESLAVDRFGLLAPEAMAKVVRPETRLISIQLANSETGTIQPIVDLAGGGTGRSPFHCDAAQAVGRLPVNFHALGVTALTLSAHKFHGPVGIGALLLRRGTKLAPLIWGGHQQQGRRPGTEPVALIVGLAKALEMAHEEHEVRHRQVQQLRQQFLETLRAQAAPVILNGPESGGVPHTVNLSFPGCNADALLMNLDLAKVACSTGSACSSGSLLPSPVLQAMHVAPEALRSALRFSLSHLLTEAEVQEAARRITRVVERLRAVGDGPEC